MKNNFLSPKPVKSTKGFACFTIKPIALLVTTCLLTGCTSTALQKNVIRQSHTVNTILADQVLYNLALYYDYYHDANSLNALPSFVKILTGTAQTQHSYGASMVSKVPIVKYPDEVDSTVSASTTTQDNWGIVPVIDVAELKRLRNLYSMLFTNVSNEDFGKMFPPPKIPEDATGHPLLQYTPILTNGVVAKGPDGKPQFDIGVRVTSGLLRSDIPGGFQADKSQNPWFTFDIKNTGDKRAIYAGTYRSHKIWILDRENFYKFTLLTLGDKGSPSSSKAITAEPVFDSFILKFNSE